MKFTMDKGKVKFTKDFPADRKKELLANGWTCEEEPKPKKTKSKKKEDK